ncbi:hypothetical protein I4U23_010644 [Adineta vaga]|nr:hypothetical protein I4U23_010644 [Adineta vaga]
MSSELSQMIIIIIFFLSLLQINGTNIPFINNTILTPIKFPFSSSSYFQLTNITCQQCLCFGINNSSLLALNCYSFNLTCQFYLQYPRAYQIQSINNSRLYFLQNIFPNKSNPCCLSNTTFLLDKLRLALNSSITSVINRPRCLLLDDDNLVATIEEGNVNSYYFTRFDPVSLVVQQRKLLNAKPASLLYRNSKYFISWDDLNIINVYNITNGNSSLQFLNNITASPMNMAAIREMIFLNSGQTMVVASAGNNLLFFYSLIYDSFYNMTSYISVTYGGPHGLYGINDTSFYAIPWNNPVIFANTTIKRTIYGSHITIDDCNRRWITLYNYGIKIYDENGISLGNLISNVPYFDTLILDNYVLIISSLGSSIITRIDPQIQCDSN